MIQKFEERFNQGYHDNFTRQLLKLCYEKCELDVCYASNPFNPQNSYCDISTVSIQNNYLYILLADRNIIAIPLKNSAAFNSSSIASRNRPIKNLFLLLDFIYDFIGYKFTWDTLNNVTLAY